MASKIPPPSALSASFAFERIAICAGLLVLTLLVFYQATSYGFAELDDSGYVTQNFVTLGGLTWTGVNYAFTSFEMGGWHPLTRIAHMLDVSLYDLDAGGHHLSSLTLHCANVLLLFYLMIRLTGEQWRGAAVAALFAIHPMHVEPVVWIASRKDMLSTFFLLLALLAWQRFTANEQPRRWYALAFLLYSCAVMSKPNVVVFPFLLLLLDYWPLARHRDRSWSKLILEKLPLAAPALAVSILVFVGHLQGGGFTALGHLSFATRLMNAVLSYGIYLLKSFWPYGLAPHYPYPDPMPVAGVIASLAVLAAVSFVVWRERERRPYLVTGWLWFLAAPLPTIGLIQTGLQAYADRYVLVAHIGLFLAVIWLIWDLLSADKRAIGKARYAFALLLLACVWRSHGQASYWRDPYTLFQHTLEVTGRNEQAYMALGAVYNRDNRPDAALKNWQEVAKMMPSHPPVYRGIAEALYKLDRQEEALQAIDKAIDLYPVIGQPYYSRGLILRKLNRGGEALQSFRKAIELGLEVELMPQAYLEMGQILSRDRDFDRAVALFQEALKIDPFYYLGRKNLAYAYLNGQKWDEAYKQFELLVRTNEHDEDVVRSLRFLKNRHPN